MKSNRMDGEKVITSANEHLVLPGLYEMEVTSYACH